MSISWTQMGGSCKDIAPLINNLNGIEWSPRQPLYTKKRNTPSPPCAGTQAKELVRTFGRRKKFLVPAGNRTPDCPSCCLIIILPTLFWSLRFSQSWHRISGKFVSDYSTVDSGLKTSITNYPCYGTKLQKKGDFSYTDAKAWNSTTLSVLRQIFKNYTNIIRHCSIHADTRLWVLNSPSPRSGPGDSTAEGEGGPTPSSSEELLLVSCCCWR
jgi:hypothetical protein